MDFFSHSNTSITGQKTGSKTLLVHAANVNANAQSAFEGTICFSLSNLKLATLLEDICRYHDLGKYTIYFQRYLLTDEKVDTNLKAHSRFGAYSLYRKHKDKDPSTAVFLYYIVLNHHGNLHDLRNNEFRQSLEAKNNERNFLKQKLSLNENMPIIVQELREEKLVEYLQAPESGPFGRTVQEIIQHPKIEHYFLVNYLFSLLIEADKLDASDTPIYPVQPAATNLVDLYRPLHFPSLAHLPDLQNATQNQLRSYCRLQVAQFVAREDWQHHRLFTLTAPTGIGKTLTALDFALKLKALILEKEHRNARIIYALPFINIIEQSLQVYTEVFAGQNIRLLAHYQYADALEQSCPDETSNYKQQTMTLDTWQCDVVITTFVQLLQTLIGNKNKLLKKFNHFAGAIIILDEVQTIRLGQLPLIGACLYYLSKFLNARILLMTATKPKIYELANQEILKAEGEEAKSLELLPAYENIFKCFSRTRIVSLIDIKIETEADFLNTLFLDKWQNNKSCIIVCNTVKRSMDVFKTVVEHINTSQNPVYYLSTNIVPLHRQLVIARIQEDIRDNRKPILIATQCVEAGVDLDFDMGFRDLGPIDSVIQVAGRINRNNHPDKKYSPLYIIDFGDCSKIYDAVTRQQSEKVLRENPYVGEEGYLELVENYFSQISANKSFQDSRCIFDAMKRLKYDTTLPQKEAAVSSFKVIEEKSSTLSVFIELDENAIHLKKSFVQLIHKEISAEDFAPFKKRFHQHIIAVPKHLPKATELVGSETNQLCEGIYLVGQSELTDFYDMTTGFNRISENKEHSMFL
jgi:CRISPR-associated endonuclease/helicase Cas3